MFKVAFVKSISLLTKFNFRYSILDVILRAIEALSAIEEHSQEICSNKELFQLLCYLVKLPDVLEVQFRYLKMLSK